MITEYRSESSYTLPQKCYQRCPIMVQPDSSIMQALIQCDSTGRARLQEIKAFKESARLQQRISIDPEPQPYKPTVITVKATVDSMGIYLTYKERYKETAQIQKIETVIEKEVNVLKWWQKLFITLGIVFIYLVAIKISAKFLTKNRFSGI
ncbi:MAG: hypothetical protein IJN02_10690 [Bacteroidales bacterium]|nr:hypothetical protein [Bacteroidales bacterium]